MHELRVVLRHVPVGPESDTSAYLAKQGIPPEAQLGSMHLWPSEWEGLSEAEMLALPPGEQVWEIAYDLLPGLRGRGLGKGMILAAMDGWIKWLGIGTVIAVRAGAVAPRQRLMTGRADGQCCFPCCC
jgi:hypothetical protein